MFVFESLLLATYILITYGPREIPSSVYFSKSLFIPLVNSVSRKLRTMFLTRK